MDAAQQAALGPFWQRLPGLGASPESFKGLGLVSTFLKSDIGGG